MHTSMSNMRWIASILIVTTFALIPTPGLITLTIPDDIPGTSTVSIPDLPQLYKKATDDTRIPFDIYAGLLLCLLALAILTEVFFRRKSIPLASLSDTLSIRAPPSRTENTYKNKNKLCLKNILSLALLRQA